MSTIKSSADHLTINADGSTSDIKFQANGVEKASISSAGAFTSTTIDATVLTGSLPAISGANLTNLPAGGATALNGLSDATTPATNNYGLGSSCLTSISGGNYNNGQGTKCLQNNSSGSQNTAMGHMAMRFNSTGSNATAIGYNALYTTTSVAGHPIAIGYSALYTGNGNECIAVGYNALYSQTTGAANIAMGYRALDAVTTNCCNVAIGKDAGGACTSERNTFLGSNAGANTTTGASNIVIGESSAASSATAGTSCTLGNVQTNNLRCNDTTISALSDQRDKAEITDLPDTSGLDLINKLRPVTFYWDRREWYDEEIKDEDGNITEIIKHTPDGTKIKRDYRSWKPNSGQRQGFIAQEVEEAITGEKPLEDSMVVSGTEDKKEFAPQHLLTNAIKAIQQLSAEMEILKSEIATLKGV